MALVYASTAAANLDALIGRVRRAVGDTETAAANQRWADDDIIEAINLEMMDLAVELGIREPGPAMESTTLSYTANADGTTLPAGAINQSIVMVEDYDNTDKPIRLRYVSPHQLEASRESTTKNVRVFTIMDDQLQVRPIPTAARTYRIWFIRSPYVIGARSVTGTATESGGTATATVTSHEFVAGMRIDTADYSTTDSDVVISAVTDTTIAWPTAGSGSLGSGTISTSGLSQQPLPTGVEELLLLGPAIRLQEADNEVPEGRRERYAGHRNRFLLAAKKARGPKYVRRNRRWM